METFKISLYVYPFEQESKHFVLLLPLTKSLRPSKRVSNDWYFFKVLDEYVYVYSKSGYTFKMVCKMVSGHLHFSRFLVNMYNEISGLRYDDDKIRDYGVYVYNLNKSPKLPLVSADKNMPEYAFNFLKFV